MREVMDELLSGGCVEGAVYEEAVSSVESGEVLLRRYGVSDDAFAVGLTSGGILDVYVEPVSQTTFPELAEVAASIRSGDPVAVVTCVAGPEDRIGKRLILWTDRAAGSVGLERLDEAVAGDVRGLLAAGRTATVHYGHAGESLRSPCNYRWPTSAPWDHAARARTGSNG